MAFAILGSPKPAFFDSSGSPLAAGTLEVRNPADDTFKATYPTYDDAEAQTNANGGTITIDGRGEVELWGRDGEAYKLTLLDALGATVWTIDDITMPVQATAIDIYPTSNDLAQDLNSLARTAGEIAAGVTPSDYSYAPGNVLRYGADNTGATDASTAAQNAIDSSLDVVFPEGTYLIQTNLTLRSGSKLRGQGRPTIKTDGVNRLVSAIGSIGTFSTITANVTRGDTTVSVAAGTGSGYTDGYYLKEDRVAQGVDTHKAGELGIVDSVVSDTVTLDGFTHDDYTIFSAETISGVTQADPGVVTATGHGLTDGRVVTITGVVGMTELNGNEYVVANAGANDFQLKGIDTTGFTAYTSGGTATSNTQAAPATFLSNISIEGLRFSNDTYTTGPTTATSALVYFEFVREFSIKDCVFEENNQGAMYFFNCLNGTVNGCNVARLRDDTGILGYGVEVGYASLNVSITNSSFRECRHAFTTGTGTGSSLTPGYGVQRGVTFAGNTVTSCTSIGIDTHEDSDGVTITGNTVSNCTPAGIQNRSYRTTITGNTIINCKGKGIRVDTSSLDTVISGNTIYAIGLNSGDGYGMEIDGKSVTITGNAISHCYSDGIRTSSNATRNITITGNECKNNGDGGTGSGIAISRGGTITRLTVTGNTCTDDRASKTQAYGMHIQTGTTTSTAHGLVASNNFYANLTDSYFNEGNAKPREHMNLGYVTENSGTGEIATGTTADIITHGLDITPTASDIRITLTEDPTNTPGAIWVDTIGASTFTVHCENDPGASGLDFSWQAVVI